MHWACWVAQEVEGCCPILLMPRDGAIIFSDLIGKLDVLRVSCEKCGCDGCYGSIVSLRSAAVTPSSSIGSMN